MDAITALTTVDFSSVFLSVFAILIGAKTMLSLFEWMFGRLGLETKWMRNKREEHELLMQTARGLAALQTDCIDNLIIAQREVLADKINEKYKYYISVNGIPEDEVDEFTDLYTAYKGVGGNHSGDAKYEYCINHLSVIPVETKLLVK